jgi:hypothetical protein
VLAGVRLAELAGWRVLAGIELVLAGVRLAALADVVGASEPIGVPRALPAGAGRALAGWLAFAGV